MRFIKIALIVIMCTLVGIFLLVAFGMGAYHQTPEKTFSRMEKQDPAVAQEIIDNYAEGLEAIAAVTEMIEENDFYSYTLNSNTSWDEEELDRMPQELVDVLRETEREYRRCSEYLFLHKGQIGIQLTDDSGGFSLLCYPGEEYFFPRSEKYSRCLDMGDGWELQMYYMPKG